MEYVTSASSKPLRSKYAHRLECPTIRKIRPDFVRYVSGEEARALLQPCAHCIPLGSVERSMFRRTLIVSPSPGSPVPIESLLDEDDLAILAMDDVSSAPEATP